MKSRLLPVIFVLIFHVINSWAQYTLSGRVYKGSTGTEPPNSSPIPGVSVKLYGANNPSFSTAVLVDSAYTNSVGWYGLSSRLSFEYYYIQETDPTGYTSQGATSVSGTVINSNLIKYDYPLDNLTLTGNKFWDNTSGPSNNPPVADADGPYSGKVGDVVLLVGSGSYDPDAGDHIVKYEWDLDLDGVYDQPCSDGDTLWVWSSPYTGKIRLKVTDSHGDTDTDEANVTITTGETESILDFGDAPASYNTLKADGGPGFEAGSVLFMGNLVDTETDGLPSSHAKGDDNDGNDDEDGITFLSPLVPGDSALIQIDFSQSSISAEPLLQGFIDFNRNGHFDSTEKVLDNVVYPPQVYKFTCWVPGDASTGVTFARFMAINQGPLTQNGYRWGEVEDNEVVIEEPESTIRIHKGAFPNDDTSFMFTGDLGQFTLKDPSNPVKEFQNASPGNYKIYENGVPDWMLIAVGYSGTHSDCVHVDFSKSLVDFDFWNETSADIWFFNLLVKDLDFGDAPDAYHTTLAQNGPYHAIGEVMLGQKIDQEPDGQPHVTAYLDDTTGVDDEDGITFATPLVAGQSSAINISFSAPPGLWVRVAGWIDIDGNQAFDDPAERIVNVKYQGTGSMALHQETVTLPSNAVTGETYARFRIYQADEFINITPAPDGPGGIGEVEDYLITITDQSEELDFGDAPASYGSASHPLSDFVLGNLIDAEPGPLYSAQADGDDLDNLDDEDGLTLFSDLVVGKDAGLQVDLHFPAGTLVSLGPDHPEVWIDYNQDGVFQEPGERIDVFSLMSCASQTMAFTQKGFHIPASAVPGQTFMRVRAMSGHNIQLTPTGLNGAGEVEDYLVNIKQEGDSFPSGYIVGGLKWNDLNQDGVLDPGEPGLFGWSIWIDLNNNGIMDAGEDAQTQVNGSWHIAGVQPGTYKVYEEQQPGWVQTFPGGSGYHTVTIQGGLVTPAIMFGNYQGEVPEEIDWGDAPLPYPDASHTISGPWLGDATDKPDGETAMQRTTDASGDDNDLDGDDENGLLDAKLVTPDKGWSLLKMRASTDEDSVVLALWLDKNQDGDWDDADERVVNFGFLGLLSFGPLPAGSNWAEVMVSFPMPPGTTGGYTYCRLRTSRDANLILQPGGHYGSGEVEDYMLEITGDDSPNPSGGIVHGYKWNDLNGDGIKNPDEPMLANWEMWLDLNQDGIQDPGDLYTVTDNTGHFLFTGLNQGTYTLGEKLQPDWTQTFPASPGTYTVQVVPQQPAPGYWFGNHQEGGSGASYLKWSQPPVFGKMDADTVCYVGEAELSFLNTDEHLSILADDWFCADPVPVTGIRWWGAYIGWDSLQPPAYTPRAYHVGIWNDVPAGHDTDWSHPGEMVRSWVLEPARVHEHAVRCLSFEGMYNDESITAFEYYFNIPPDEWFIQEEDSTIWWLSVAAIYDSLPPADQEDWYPWGWIKREHYFQDNAVVMFAPLGMEPGTMAEVHEPLAGHWDLAFQLETTEYIRKFDFGDAPHTYGTLLIHNGAQHAWDPLVYMGERIDVDADGQPHPDALGDDNDGMDDEDGVGFLSPLGIGGPAELRVNVSRGGFLSIWLDIDRNGDWFGEGERVLDNMELVGGEHHIGIDIPRDAVEGYSMMRFRFSTRPLSWVNGYAIDGEVEDYAVDLVRVNDVEQEPDDPGMPMHFELYPNVPNPFNPETFIRFDVPERAHVTLTVYNLLGQKIVELTDAVHPAGEYAIRWDGHDQYGRRVSSGVYLYVMQASGFNKVQKMVLIR